jgi:N-acetylglucosamine-6-phosphate deacetylase
VAISYTTQHFFDGQALHSSTEIVVHDGVIEAIRPFSGTPEHFAISPGLIDVQMNGFGTVDVSVASGDDFAKLDAELLSHGTTSWLATVVTAPLDRLDKSVRLIDSNISNSETGCVGVHIEGPFLGAAPGAHNPEWIIPLDTDWCANLPSTVKLMTVAPEQLGVISNINALTQRGICVSLGHTQATEEQWTEAVASGSRMVTHLFNGMSGLHHRDGGVAMFALTDERIVCGLIADLVHVSSRAVSLAFAAKGHKGICLVSDSIAWNAQWAQRRGIKIINGAPRLPDGTLAGSSTPLSRCVQHAVRNCGVSLESALASATSTPASILGYPQMGRVLVGQRADLAVFDSELSVVEARRGLVSSRG